jgi:hypothetical protein
MDTHFSRHTDAHLPHLPHPPNHPANPWASPHGSAMKPSTTAAAPAPPKAPPPRKAANAAQCQQLEQLPNIGPSIAADLRSLGITSPVSLAGRDAFVLYQQLCSNTGKRHDPCVLDTFMAAVDFMGGAEPRPWWTYTALRKAMYGVV